MAQVNTCLKRVFTIFNILFAILGALIILFALMSQIFTNVNGGENLEGRTYSLVLLYVVGAITMVIAILGAHGAHKESRGCLIAFLVCMVTGTLLMLRVGVAVSVTRPELDGTIKEAFEKFLPLDRASDDVKEMADSAQAKLHCCGFFSYRDWTNDIPSSCDCGPAEEEGVCQSVNIRSSEFVMQSRSIYAQPCFPIFLHYLHLISDAVIGIIFTLAGLALLGTILSSVIIHQMRRPTTATVVLKVPAVFAASPPKYQELQNPPPSYC